MLTIEQASLEYAEHEANDFPSGDCRADMNLCEIEDWFKDAFKAGAEFAQRWVSVEEELPEIGEKVITKMTKDKRTAYGIATRIREEWGINAHWIDHTFSNMNITHWRPVNLK